MSAMRPKKELSSIGTKRSGKVIIINAANKIPPAIVSI
jgi:hypothetical protein